MRVLEVVTGNFDVGGLSQIVFRWGEGLIQDNIIFDYHCRKYYEENVYTKKIRSYGGQISYPEKKLRGLRKEIDFYHRQDKLIQKNKYSVVHVHADTSYNMLKGALMAKMRGVNKIILHSHSAGIDRHSANNFSLKYAIRIILHKLFRIILPLFGNTFCACSENAANWMYIKCIKKRYVFIPNAINVKEFKFDPEVRKCMRKKHGFSNYTIVGHVGRFVYQKNHRYILKIARYAQGVNKKIIFILAGDGELFEEIKNEAEAMGIRNIYFIGKSNEVNKWMQAFDVLIMPSHFEGLPVVGIEAQAAGIPCVFSNKIDNRSKILDGTSFLPINDDSLSEWYESIIKCYGLNRAENSELVSNSEFNIEKSIMRIKEVYCN